MFRVRAHNILNASFRAVFDGFFVVFLFDHRSDGRVLVVMSHARLAANAKFAAAGRYLMTERRVINKHEPAGHLAKIHTVFAIPTTSGPRRSFTFATYQSVKLHNKIHFVQSDVNGRVPLSSAVTFAVARSR